MVGVWPAGWNSKEDMMRLSWRDGLATVFVGVGAVLYVLWLAGIEVAGPRVLAGIVLGLGLAASITAVVYGVGAGLLRVSKVYLAVASLIGLAALVAGVMALVAVNEPMLAVLVVATVVLWMMSTVRHVISTAEYPGTQQASDHPPLDSSFRNAA
jgi:hypothetical protein